MKITSTNEHNKFQPIIVTLTIESLDEFNSILSLCGGMGRSAMIKIFAEAIDRQGNSVDLGLSFIHNLYEELVNYENEVNL